MTDHDATTPIYRLGLVSDLHALSRYGLVPPRFWPRGGTDAQPSAIFYEYLWKCWEDCCARCPPLDCLIVNGDIIEGENPSKKDAMDALTDDLLAQGSAAEEILGMIRPKARSLWMTRGTPYHEGRYFETLEAIAKNLHAEPWTRGRYTGYVLEAQWRGLSINATHHMTVGAIYRGTLADRTALFSTAAEALGKAHHADVIVRSHLHMKYVGKSHGRWVILTPAWKLITPYAIKRMEFYRASLNSDLGMIVIETDGTSRRLLIDDETLSYAPYRSALRQLDAAGADPHAG